VRLTYYTRGDIAECAAPWLHKGFSIPIAPLSDNSGISSRYCFLNIIVHFSETIQETRVPFRGSGRDERAHERDEQSCIKFASSTIDRILPVRARLLATGAQCNYWRGC
jgi:hypothetical protein